MPQAPSTPDDEIFDLRLARSAADLWPMLDALYGGHPDYPRFRKTLLKTLRKGWADRPADLKRLDLQARSGTRLVPAARHGGLCLLHRPLRRQPARRPGQAGLPGRPRHHLCPPDALPEAAPRRQRRRLFGDGLPRRSTPPSARWRISRRSRAALRARGICLCVDLVLNHTAKEHAWAKKAAQGRRDAIRTTT